MPSIESFPTKRGTARFTEDSIHFEESFSGYIQSLYQEFWQRGTWWHNGIFVGYILAFPIGLGWVVSAVRGGDFFFLAVVVGSIAMFWVMNYARGFRSPDRIQLDTIEKVSATAGMKGLTRPRLIITYIDGETTYRRRVNLQPLYTSNGETAYEQAQAAFAERGF
ncbi:hypothetical protein ACFR9U_15820 [Halorientalis brevis]|uniref:Uncharacterized protein n=1 Tax=Halorientalis brevis TaxID=1126241 RepID=A0ABD6CDU7_9EURY|nr:hypothetical protein [Halorientalis brevis]